MALPKPHKGMKNERRISPFVLSLSKHERGEEC